MEYHLRIDKSALKCFEDLESWVKDNGQHWLISYEEPVDNPHYQGYIRTLKKDSALRKSLTKILLSRGNKAYSLSKCRDTEELLQYCCKDGNVVMTTFSQEQVDVYKRIGAERKAQVKAKVDKKKAKPLNTIEKLYRDIDCNRNSREVFKDVVRWYAKNSKCFLPLQQFANLVKTLRFKALTEKGSDLAEQVLDSWVEQVYGGWVGGPTPEPDY